MSHTNLLALVERLREAGQRKHDDQCNHVWAWANEATPRRCVCGTDEANAAVDAAAKALVAEIGQLPERNCRECLRGVCPHSGKHPKAPGPPHGCSSFLGMSADLKSLIEATPVLTKADLEELGDAVKEALDEK